MWFQCGQFSLKPTVPQYKDRTKICDKNKPTKNRNWSHFGFFVCVCVLFCALVVIYRIYRLLDRPQIFQKIFMCLFLTTTAHNTWATESQALSHAAIKQNGQTFQLREFHRSQLKELPMTKARNQTSTSRRHSNMASRNCSLRYKKKREDKTVLVLPVTHSLI